jgi:hypothetical protein
MAMPGSGKSARAVENMETANATPMVLAVTVLSSVFITVHSLQALVN